MRFKESLKLDHLIDERRESLLRTYLDKMELDKRVLLLAVLMETRTRLDEIANMKSRDDVVFTTKFIGTDENGRKIRPRRNRNQRRRHLVTRDNHDSSVLGVIGR